MTAFIEWVTAFVALFVVVVLAIFAIYLVAFFHTMTPSIRTRILLALAVASIGLFLISTIGSMRTEFSPSSSKTFAVSVPDMSKAPHRAAKISTPSHPLFTLMVTISPAPIMEDSDAKIIIVISELAFPPPSGHALVGVESESFAVVPSENRLLTLRLGEAALYVITPKGKGEKKLRVYASHVEPSNTVGPDIIGPPVHPEFEQIIDVSVLGRSFFGLSNKALSSLQVASAIFGFPGIVMLFLTRWLDSRKTKNKKDMATKS